MGKSQSKIENPNANVINEVEVLQEQTNWLTIEILLFIITFLSGINFLFTIYKMHFKKLKKEYTSTAINLDKV